MKTLIVIFQAINILLFGHSFGVDCSEYVPSLAVEAGVENLHFGRFIKANCSLEEHWDYLQCDTTAFYSEAMPGERYFTVKEKTVREALAETEWDYVIFQTSLENEGRYETFQPYLNDLIDYVLKASRAAGHKKPKIGWNMFWPVSILLEDGSNPRATYRLSFYGNSSEKMYEAYRDAAGKVLKKTKVSFVIPSGATVMAARESELNTPQLREFTRDGYHLSEGYGRYMAACTWFEKLLAKETGISVVGNPLRISAPVDPERNSVISDPVTDDAVALRLQELAAQTVRSVFPR